MGTTGFKRNLLSRHLLRMLAVVVGLGLAVGLLLPAQRSWIGPADRMLRFRVVDAGRGVPIAGAAVSLIQPFNPEQPPIVGKTDAEGLVELRGRFTRSGMVDGWGRAYEHVSFTPWFVRAEAEKHRDFCASLSFEETLNNQKCDPPLRLDDPPPSPIKIALEAAGERDE